MFIALHGKALASALVVGILFEKRSAPNAAIQDVKSPFRPAYSENLLA
jgi:hypothetical protein